ncbi:hypothetical protein V865_005919 [Kwoniella europaea PYCC6329]|uniref:FAS1 domain-containing protein n=1 Tax=Kwoniella europaea PYCC6329 TaxID=1423913 RepID=A0AAX4KPC0_9TREE
MAGRLARTLRLHTFPGQVLFLSTVSVIGGWGITQLGEDEDRHRPFASRSSRNKGSSMQGDLVDAIQSGSGISGGGGGGGPTLADALTAERGASLWWSYARDSKSITERLQSRNQRSTILVPVDKAIVSLKQKPHLYSGSSSTSSSSIMGWVTGSNSNSHSYQDNTEKFLKAHIIEGSPQPGKLQTLLDGFSLEIIQNPDQSSTKISNLSGKGWKIQPGDIEVLGIKETSNGRIIYINKVLPY